MIKQKKYRIISMEDILSQFRPVSTNVFGRYSPSIRKTDKGYTIRVLVKQSFHGQSMKEEYDYFEINNDGVIISAPHGYAKQYKPGRMSLEELAATTEEYFKEDAPLREIYNEK